METVIELGLLGHGIDRSMAPMLQEALGLLTGREVCYPLHDTEPSSALGLTTFLTGLANRGVTGINVTHPFKELVADLVKIDDPLVQAIGAVNTVRFDLGGPAGFNTDYSGMQQAYHHRFDSAAPGVVAQLGAGGFGRAAAFAMAALGATTLRLFDPERQQAMGLAERVADVTGLSVDVFDSAEAAVDGAEGVINCSPIGMYLHPGCPIDPSALGEARWVFDAVYAPLRTELLAAAGERGVETMSGSALFFWQGIHSFEIFHRTAATPATIDKATAIVNAEILRRSALEE